MAILLPSTPGPTWRSWRWSYFGLWLLHGIVTRRNSGRSETVDSARLKPRQ
jgi:hypothetical protein